MRLLSISGLAISFGGISALAGVDIETEENEILAIIGPNGSGKTTLFNCITGVYKPSRGNILFQGTELIGRSPHSIASIGIARTFQNIRLFNNMSVLDNLMLGRHVRRGADGVVVGGEVDGAVLGAGGGDVGEAARGGSPA